MAGSDRGRKRIAICLLDELDYLFWTVEQACLSSTLMFPRRRPAFPIRPHADAFGMRAIDHTLCSRNVFSNGS
jgi:hypothetical protein